jgi:hypothetical protein
MYVVINSERIGNCQKDRVCFLNSFVLSQFLNELIWFRSIASWPDCKKDFDQLLEEFNESYQGYYGGVMKDAKTEFTYQLVEDTGLLSGAPQILERYFDYEAYAEIFFWKAIPNLTVTYYLASKFLGLTPG